MIALAIGRKEQGKTTLGYHLTLAMPQRVVFDPRDRFQTSEIFSYGTDVYDLLVDGEHEVIVYAAENAGDRFTETCDELKEWVKENREKRFGFMIDEVAIAMENGIPESFQWLIRATKVDQARIIMTTWRPTEVHPSIRSQIDHWFIFKTTEERDLDIIAEKCGDTVALQVQSLVPYAFLHCDDSHAERQISIVNDPKLWYVNTEMLQEQNLREAPGAPHA